MVEAELARVAKSHKYSEELLGLIGALLRHDPEARPSAMQLLRCGACGEMWGGSTGELRTGVTLSNNAGFFGAC